MKPSVKRFFKGLFALLCFVHFNLKAQPPCVSTPLVTNLTLTPNPYCAGSTVTLGLANQYTVSGLLYTWSTGNSSVASNFSNFTIGTSPTIGINPTAAIWLRVAVTCTNGNQTTTTQPVFLNVATNSMTVSNALVCSGQQASLSALSAGVLNWYSSPTSTVSLGSGSVFITPTLSAGNYTYYAEATNACTFAPFRFPATVSVNVSPTISVSNVTLCLNQNTHTIFPSGALSYTFSSGNPIVSPTVTSVYTVSGTNSVACISSSTLMVTKLNFSSPNVAVNSGSICLNFVFTLQPSGALNYTIEGGSALVSPSISSTYTVVGKDANGCSAMATSSVTVWPSPSISVTNASICIGKTHTINPSGAVSYTYAGGGPVVSPTITSSYAIIGTDANGCVTPSAQMVTVFVHTLIPNVTVNSGTICLGNTFFITPSGADTYTYSGVSNWVSPIVSTVYTVTGKLFTSVCTATATSTVIVQPGPSLTVSNVPSVICAGESASITANGALSYTWNNVFNGNFLIVSPLANSNYTIVGMDGFGCITSTVVTQYVNKCLIIEKLYKETDRLVVYPNPGEGHLVIEVPWECELRLLGLDGHIYFSRTLAQGEHAFEFSNLAEGLYIIETKGDFETQRLKWLKY